MAQIRTFHPRRRRISVRLRDALDQLLPRYGVPVADEPAAPLDGAVLFGRRAPLVLEIGSGMGEAALAMAAADPARDYLAVEIHTPGLANLLAGVAERGLTNVRVAQGDGLRLLQNQVRPGTLDAIHAFFPDPWPKSRHHKRRLVQPAHAALMSSRLTPGGTLWCATDWADYAAAMLATLTADPLLINTADGYARRPARRPLTRFEQRAVDAGRRVFDLVFTRR